MYGTFSFSFNGETVLFPAFGPNVSSTVCTNILESLPNIGTVQCIQDSVLSDGSSIYTIQFLSWPVVPYENNVYTNTGYPPVAAFTCDTSNVMGVSQASCLVADVTVPNYPSKYTALC